MEIGSSRLSLELSLGSSRSLFEARSRDPDPWSAVQQVPTQLGPTGVAEPTRSSFHWCVTGVLTRISRTKLHHGVFADGCDSTAISANLHAERTAVPLCKTGLHTLFCGTHVDRCCLCRWTRHHCNWCPWPSKQTRRLPNCTGQTSLQPRAERCFISRSLPSATGEGGAGWVQAPSAQFAHLPVQGNVGRVDDVTPSQMHTS